MSTKTPLKNHVEYTSKDVFAMALLVVGTAVDYFSTVLFIGSPNIIESNPIVRTMLQYPPSFLMAKLVFVGILLWIYYDSVYQNPDEHVRFFFQLTAGSIGILWLCIGLNNVALVF